MAEQEQNQSTNLNLSDQAMTFLGLSQQPFAAAILPTESIFSDATREQLIDTTKHHLQFSDLLLIIEGDIGSGKTTLFRQLLQSDIENLLLISIPASATDTLTQIQQSISVNLKDQGDANYLDDNLKRLQAFDQTPVLIIDDAHVLADTTIQELLRYQKQLETEKEVKLKILMLANKGMAKTIETITDIQHNQLYVQEMPSYTVKQIHAFLLQRLNAVNYQGEDYFNNDILERISKKSNGIPFQILEQGIIQLEKLAKKQSGSSSNLMKPSVLFAGLIIIILTGMIGYYFLHVDTLLEQNAGIQEPVESAPTELDLNTLDDTAIISDPAEPPPAIEIKENLASEVTDNVTDTPIDNNEALTTNIGNTIEDNKAITAIEADTTDINSKTDATSKAEETEIKNTAEAEPIKLTEAPAEPIQLAEPPVEVEAKTEVIKAEPVIEKVKTVEVKPLNTQLAKLNSFGIRDADWIMQQNAQNWTLQIMGARDPATLVKFATQHKLGQTSAWFKTELSGKPWYVLIHRLYTDKDIARQSIQRLPAGLKASKPWVKNMGAIQKSIKP